MARVRDRYVQGKTALNLAVAELLTQLQAAADAEERGDSARNAAALERAKAQAYAVGKAALDAVAGMQP